jgi:hypothetical protein
MSEEERKSSIWSVIESEKGKFCQGSANNVVAQGLTRTVDLSLKRVYPPPSLRDHTQVMKEDEDVMMTRYANLVVHV